MCEGVYYVCWYDVDECVGKVVVGCGLGIFGVFGDVGFGEVV